jgi:hypothetical protein
MMNDERQVHQLEQNHFALLINVNLKDRMNLFHDRLSETTNFETKIDGNVVKGDTTSTAAPASRAHQFASPVSSLVMEDTCGCQLQVARMSNRNRRRLWRR